MFVQLDTLDFHVSGPAANHGMTTYIAECRLAGQRLRGASKARTTTPTPAQPFAAGSALTRIPAARLA
jgi:hypothetical protein